MTLEPYHDFFVACAGVAGALIGLLFVAISLNPEKVTGPNADPRLQVRATAAFSALLNPLALALFSLIPDTAMITALFVVSLSGLLSCVKAFIVLFRKRSGVTLIHAGIGLLMLGQLLGDKAQQCLGVAAAVEAAREQKNVHGDAHQDEIEPKHYRQGDVPVNGCGVSVPL